MKNDAFERAISRLRLETAIQKLDWHLDGRVPRGRRRQIREELRAHLAESAQVQGPAEAVRQLGDIRKLAAEYLAVDAGRVDLRAGTWAAIIMFAALQAIGVAIFLAFVAGVDAAGGHGHYGYSAELIRGFGPFAGSVGGLTAYEMSFLTPAHIVLMAVAFLIGSRAWRLSRR
jgi:hypothetical protein